MNESKKNADASLPASGYLKERQNGKLTASRHGLDLAKGPVESSWSGSNMFNQEIWKVGAPRG